MTVVIGIKHKGDVYIGSDGRVTAGDNITTDSFIKQVDSHGATFAFCGSVSVMNAMKYALRVGLKTVANKITCEDDVYAIYEFVYRTLKDNGMVEAGDVLNIQMIIGTESGKLFQLEGDGCVIEHDRYVAAGSGGNTAEAILSQLVINNPEREIKYVMKEVFKKHSGTGGKIKIKVYPGRHTKSKLKKILSSKLKK